MEFSSLFSLDSGFLLIVVVIGLRAQRKLRLHGIVMFIAVILHAITLLVVMLPSFLIGLISYIFKIP